MAQRQQNGGTDPVYDEAAIAVEEVERLWASIQSHEAQLYQQRQLLNQENCNAVELAEKLEKHLTGTLWPRMRVLLEMETKQKMEAVVKACKANMNSLEQTMVEWKQNHRLALLSGPKSVEESIQKLPVKDFHHLERILGCFGGQVSKLAQAVRSLASIYGADELVGKLCNNLLLLCQELTNEASNMLNSLVAKSLVVTIEPVDFVRRNCSKNEPRTREGSKIPFPLTLCVLAGQRSQLVPANTEVELRLISGKQAHAIVEKKLNPCSSNFKPDGELQRNSANQNPTRILEQDISTPYLKASYPDVRVRTHTGADKKAEADTSEDVYHILFLLKRPGATGDYHPFWAITLPFSVSSNSRRQAKFKNAFMFWHLSFCVQDSTGLLLPKEPQPRKVPWQVFFPFLNKWFKRFLGAERGIEKYEKSLAEKLGLAGSTYRNGAVTFEMLYKKKMVDKKITDKNVADKTSTSFSFWEWLHANTAFLKDEMAEGEKVKDEKLTSPPTVTLWDKGIPGPRFFPLPFDSVPKKHNVEVLAPLRTAYTKEMPLVTASCTHLGAGAIGKAHAVGKVMQRWCTEFIEAFISKPEVEQVLSQATGPSLIIRFSESTLCTIVISYVDPRARPVKPEHIIYDGNFSGTSIRECVRHSKKLHNATILTVGRPVSELLEGEFKQETDTALADGYVRPMKYFDWEEPVIVEGDAPKSRITDDTDDDTEMSDSDDIAIVGSVWANNVHPINFAGGNYSGAGYNCQSPFVTTNDSMSPTAHYSMGYESLNHGATAGLNRHSASTESASSNYYTPLGALPPVTTVFENRFYEQPPYGYPIENQDMGYQNNAYQHCDQTNFAQQYQDAPMEQAVQHMSLDTEMYLQRL